jgi:hypothetical protein
MSLYVHKLEGDEGCGFLFDGLKYATNLFWNYTVQNCMYVCMFAEIVPGFHSIARRDESLVKSNPSWKILL